MLKRTQRSRAAVALLLLLALAACTDKKLRDLVVASDRIADTVTIVQRAVVDSENANLLTRNQARGIMVITMQISTANNNAMDIARDLSKLDEPSRAQLLTVLTPIIAVANSAVNDASVTGIQDVKTREAIRGAFVAIQSSLNSINLILAAGN